MISKLNKRYLVQIASKVGGERKKRLAKKNPEECLTSLLKTIRDEAHRPNAILQFTVERSLYDDTVKEARQFLQRYKRKSVRKKVLSATR